MRLVPSFNVAMVLMVIGILSLPLIANAVSDRIGFSVVTVEDLSKIQEKTADALQNLNQRLSIAGGAVMATLLTFMFTRYRSSIIPRGQLATAIAIATSALSSLIFAFYVDRTIIWMTEQGAIDTRIPRYALESDGQMLTLVSSGILFLILAVREFRRDAVPAERP